MSLSNNTKAMVACVILFSLAFSSYDAQAQTSISGAISLPTGVISDGNITIESRLTEIPFGRSTFFEDNTISSGNNKLSFNFSLIEPSSVDEVIITFRCINNCLNVDGRLRTLFYLQDDGTIDYVSNSVPISDVPDTLDLQFPEPPEIETLTGSINLPTGVTSEGNFIVSYGNEIYDENGNEIPDTGSFAVFIPSGSSSAPYLMSYRKLAADYEVAIYFGCLFNSNCIKATNTINDLFYLQDDGSFATEFNTIPAADMTSTLDFQFAPVDTLFGTISLPTGVISDGRNIVSFSVAEYDNGGNLVTSAGRRETVPLGSSDKLYSLNYFEPDSESQMAISFSCDRCIEGEELTYYYLQDDGSFDPAFNTIAVSDVPSRLDFQFTKEVPPVKLFPIQFLPGIILLLLS